MPLTLKRNTSEFVRNTPLCVNLYFLSCRCLEINTVNQTLVFDKLLDSCDKNTELAGLYKNYPSDAVFIITYSAVPDSELRSIPPSIRLPDSEYVGFAIDSINLYNPQYSAVTLSKRTWQRCWNVRD